MMKKMRGMPQGHPLLPAPDGLTFYLDLIYLDCTAVLSALDLTNPNAFWETVSLVLGGPAPPPPCNLLPSTPQVPHPDSILLS